MLDQLGRAVIGEAAGKPLDQPDRPVGGAQQQRPGIRGDRAAVKRRHHRAPFDAVQTRTDPRYTLSASGLPLAPETNRSSQHDFLRSRAPMHLPPLRNPG